jgi:NADH-quinone oxidoreductase subunit G
MLDIEIDGKALQVEPGTTIIEAAHKLGTYIPHFCYHKKLSIAANCRMCLVQVEKAPKPMPACATPVTNGMKVFTHSDMAITAQKGVMEFLLINHPLDCPICDQGGECQLQDLAVGYGASASQYEEEKRVVPNKDLGALVSTDMTRCINCTRCVRFTQEIAGMMELGQAFRGERAEVMSFINQTVDSELSGNIIDLCPVGALTSKPFRFAARTWELSRRKSVSPHDGLGSNLIVQTKHDRVLRVLPLENESINECWLSDKDRFSYDALNSPERLLKPMVKNGGQWREVEWNVALDYVSHALRDVAKSHGGSAIGALVSPHSTLEEMYLAQKFLRGVGSENIDFRLRQSDFSADASRSGTPWLGLRVAELSQLDRVLVVGSFLRKDQPLLAQRLRQIAKRGAQVNVVHSADDDLYIKLHSKHIVAPSKLPTALAEIVKAVAVSKGASAPAEVLNVAISSDAQRIADSLLSGERKAILLGNFAQQHAQAATLHALAAQLAELIGCTVGFLGDAANSVGGYVANALPTSSGLNAAAMFAEPRKAYVLLGVEPELDCADGVAALSALNAAATVIVMSPFKSDAALEYADVLLPVAPFAETSGTFVNTEGRAQSFYAVAKPQGETRPAWKVLRVLGNLLNVSGFDYASSEEIRTEALDNCVDADGFVSGLNNATTNKAVLGTNVNAAGNVLERVADVPIHFTDALVRRSRPLQATRDALAPMARINAATMADLGLSQGQAVKVGAGGTAQATLRVARDDGIPAGCVRIAAAHASTINAGPMCGLVSLSKGGAL